MFINIYNFLGLFLKNPINLLLLIITLLILFILFIYFIPKYKLLLIKKLSLYFSFIIFALTLLLLITFNNNIENFVYIKHIP